jgi:hypothetical protein
MTFFLLFIVVIITFIVQANIFLLCFRHYEKSEYTFQKFIKTMNLEFESIKYPEIELEEKKKVKNKIRNKLINYEYEN